MIVADTDVLIDFLQGREPIASMVEAELRRERLATTAITHFELLAGVRTKRQGRVVRDLLAAMSCLALDAESASTAADVRRELDRKGAGIGMADSLIAGIAMQAGGILLTRNRKHFERVEGLELMELPDA